MPTYTYPFSGGIDAQTGWGDRWNITFGGTWAFSDGWSIAVTSTEGDFTLGVGRLFINNLGSALMPATVCFTYRNRVYLGLGSQFNFSENGDPTSWEEQNPGAGFVEYLSEFGSQDTIVAFGQLQGRLAVIAERSIQLWQVDADPANFQLVQTLDNIGTLSALAVQQQGDLDVLFLDATGVRSIRSREVTLNAYVDDVGSPIDVFIQVALDAVGGSGACAIVEPQTKNYWLYLNGIIYVLSRHPSAKITAWSEYEPRGDNNATFAAQKFVVLNRRVYCRSTTRGFYVYGGATNTVYDQYAIVTLQTPYLDDKRPGNKKSFQGLSHAKEGKWEISLSADPQSNNFVPFSNFGTTASPDALTDSSYDLGNMESQLIGTHFSAKAVSQPDVAKTSLPVVFGSLLIYYNPAETTG